MRILFTGDFQPDYNRTLILMDGSKKLGIEFQLLLFKKNTKEVRKQLIEVAQHCDIVFLPAFAHRNVCFIKSLLKLPILFDPLISRYLTKVFDYKTISPFSPRALKNYFKDYFSLRCANRIIADTSAPLIIFSKSSGLTGRNLTFFP